MRRGAAVVATLVLVAGCSAVPFGSGDPRRGPTDTVTPVPVTDGPTPTRTLPDDLPPGVLANGTVDADALTSAHAAHLVNRTYTWSVSYDTDGADGDRLVRRLVVGRETFTVSQTRGETGRNVSLYVNATGGYLRAVEAGETRYDLLPLPGRPEDYDFATVPVRQMFDDRRVSVSTVERGDRTYYRLYAAGDPPPAVGPAEATISRFSATAYVTPEGFVRSMAAEYDRVVDGERARVTMRYDYSRLGESNPTPPDWLGEVPRLSTPAPADPDATPEGTATPDTATPNGTGTATPDGTATPSPNGTAAPTPTDELDGSPAGTPASG
ncbi:hypothetical protein [Halosimplex halobium]|uniref:hypothetical protein n=1 Tax=Halosimplex halobium TaxID=3396618 RepID=UPI003F55C0E0